MSGSSNFASLKRLLALVVMALMIVSSGIIPRGYMIAPSAAHGFDITICPETNPLARMVAHKQSEEQRELHASMGHHMEPSDSAPSAGQSGGDCAFAGFAGHDLTNDVQTWHDQTSSLDAPLLPAYRARTATRLWRLRPPLRGPPVHV